MDTLPVRSAIKHVKTQLCICPIKIKSRFIAYCISFVTKQKGKHLFKQARKWTGKFHWQVTLDQQLIDAKSVWQKGESNSSCLACWSLDSQTICCSRSALSQQMLQKMTKLVRYFHWSVVLFQLCFLFRYPELTLFPLSSVSLLLIHSLSLSVQVHAFSLERPFIECTQRNAVIHSPAATVQYVCAFSILLLVDLLMSVSQGQ